jgi:hypothetical protein
MVLLGLIVASFAIPSVLSNSRLGGAASASASDVGREYLRDRALAGFDVSPVTGLGLQHFGTAVMVPIDLLVSGGFVLAVAYYLYLFIAAKTALRLTNVGYLVGVNLAVSVLAIVLIGLGQNVETERYLYWPVAVALAAALSRRSDRPSSGEPDHSQGEAQIVIPAGHGSMGQQA